MTDLDAVLDRLTDRWELDGLELVGRGLEFTVFRALGPDGAPVALRLAERRFESNANDPRVDTRVLLAQEYEITRHLSALGFPVAEPLELRLGDDDTTPDLLLSRFVTDDGSGLDGHHLGALLARLHRLPAPRLTPVAAEGTTTAGVLAARILRRWAEVGRLVDGWPAPPDLPRLAAPLSGIGTSGLVHLDVRSDNVRRVGGQVEALVDWSNALLGDAVVEFGRLTEYARYPENDLDLPAIRAGYAEAGHLPPADTPAELVCRLDAALMLALVFLSEAPDPQRGPAAADHARALGEQVAAAG
ncbi:phosphotransferase family protein [Micromonospora okii]|uniref:phosphotransferase family protein n=1 Tax=Micromonospora okii TaxID=1182970 RepID=UPI001E2A89E8|nr:aminoglycoside phosphotransferase family protein [Micromonospora okii]